MMYKTMQNNINRHENCRRIMVALFVALYSLSFCLSADAQTFTQQLQQRKPGEGAVVIHHSAAIESIVNGPQPSKKQPERLPSGGNGQATASTLPTEREQANDTIEQQPVRTGRTYKTTGYRVQVFAGGHNRTDRRRAESIGNQVKALFPNEMVYVKFQSPRWTCRVGNYRTYEEAHMMQQQLKQLDFRSATIVKSPIVIQY